MIDRKQFKKDCWEIRKERGKKRLGKKDLYEAYKRRKDAQKNIIMFQDILKGVVGK